MSNGGSVSSETYGGGASGRITLQASESVSISDPGSKIFSGTEGKYLEPDDPRQDAGMILIETPEFSLSNKAVISCDTYDGGGNGGNITISGTGGNFAESVKVSDGQILSGTNITDYSGTDTFAGNGGTVEIRAGNIVFENGGKVRSESNSNGTGGDVFMYADSVRFSGTNADGDASKVYTSAKNTEDYAGSAGNIFVEADNILFENRGGLAADTEGPGHAGVINITARDSVRLENHSSISTESSDRGKAGDITVKTCRLELENGSSISSKSELALDSAGRSSSFTLSLQSRPDADVTISVSSSDSTEGTVSPSSLTFTGNNWNTAQTVTVTGTDDEETDGSSAYTVVLSPASSADTGYSGADPEDVSVTNADDDSPGFTVSTASGKTAEDGTQAFFTVRLNTEPWATLVLDVVSSDTGEGTASPGHLKFTHLDWNTDQTVTVTGVYDTLADGDQEYAVQLAVNAENTTDSTYKKLDPTDVSLTNLDLDIPPTTSGIAGITVSEDAADTVIDLWEAFDDAHDGDEGLVWSVKNNTNETLFSSVKTDAGRYLVLSYAENAEGAAYITVSATDTGGLSADTTFSVTVSATDDPPTVAIPIPDVSVNEDAPDTVIDLCTVFADADNDDAAIVKSVRTNTNSALVAATAEGNTLTLASRQTRQAQQR
ncbi:MAG: hypothetical protein GY749_04720 [Desulfobacteraceae bacterium]|nr:hypothetical protein [Desulfobacteraceae bacterium]